MEKEINFERALAVLKQGGTLECQLSYREDNRVVVSTKERLEYLYNLSQLGIQKCIIFEKTQDKAIPDNAIEISFDEAYEMVYGGDLVYYQEDGEEKEITSISELISLRKSFDIRGKNLFLYWND